MSRAKLCAGIFLACLACRQNPYQQGARLYDLHCANCHMADGAGLANLYPSLRTEDFRRYTTAFPCIVRFGLSDTISVGEQQFSYPMPGNKALNAVEISNIYNYIIYEWHPDLKAVTSSEMELALKECTNP